MGRALWSGHGCAARSCPPPSQGQAIDRDHVGFAVAEAFEPIEEAALEQRGVECRDHLPQRVMAGDAMLERQEATQETQVLASPQADLDEIVRPGDRGAQQKQQDFW